MILNKLTIEGFKVIADPLTIHFPSEGVIGILGQNESGKSTILETIEFALFGPIMLEHGDKGFQDLISWGKEKARVILEFTIGTHRYKVQRRITTAGNHAARLSLVVNGSADMDSTGYGATEGISAVSQEIESLLRLNRTTFTKLLNVKQGELDVLIRLEKSNRELLLNKLAGIEVLDVGIEDVRKDRQLVESEIQAREAELKTVENNKQAFEKRLSEKQDLERFLDSISPELASSQSELKEVRSKLESYRWRSKFDSLNDLLVLERNRAAEINSEQADLSDYKTKLVRYEEALDRFKPEVNRLNEAYSIFKQLEEKYSGATQRLQTAKTERDKMKENLSQKERALLSREEADENFAGQRRTKLAALITLLVVGAALISISIFTNPIYFVAGLAALAVSVLIVKRYETVENYLANSEGLRSLLQEIHQLDAELQSLDLNLKDLRKRYGFESFKEIGTRLSEISTQIEHETVAKSIEQLVLITGNLKEEIAGILTNDNGNRLIETANRIDALNGQISELLSEKPEKADQFQKQGPAQLKTLQEQYVAQTTEWKTLEIKISDSQSILDRVREDLRILKGDFEAFPTLQSKLAQLRNELVLLNQLEKELRTTSEELRRRIVPNASYLVNQILPLLTAHRYSNFEIADDLTFKAYSTVSGNYEQLDVFSRGTQDQFMLGLRLAFAKSLIDERNIKDDSFCVLLDDVLSTSDDRRKIAILKMLKTLQTAFSQIIITAHDDIASHLDYAIVLAKDERGFTKLGWIGSTS